MKHLLYYFGLFFLIRQYHYLGYSGKKLRWFAGLLLICWFTHTPVWGQDSLNNITTYFKQYQQVNVPEKLYLHLDRPAYQVGETMWFKIYYVHGQTHEPLDLSKVAYVEVINTARQPVLQAKITLKQGIGQGYLQLPATLNTGNYTVRAYTNWMKNYNPDFYFHATIAIYNPFNKPQKAANPDSVAYDLQFFPEGGHLVADLNSKVAFKLVNSYGQGIDFTGQVLDAENKVVTELKSVHQGMGYFFLTPSAIHKYSAVIKLPNNKILKQPLPVIYPEGYVMQLTETEPDKIELMITGSSPENKPLYFLAHTRQNLVMATVVALYKGKTIISIDKNKLAPGISHFTLFNAQKQPIGERLYFKPPTQDLTIQAKTDKLQYTSREKVTLDLATTHPTGQAAPANLSVAVYLLDSLQSKTAPHINSFLWLTSDLKGTIENPEYYVTGTNQQAAAAVDILMLTHGWRRFKWEQIFSKKQPAFAYMPELKSPILQGKVLHAGSGKPAGNITTYLTTPSLTPRFYHSISNAAGQVLFEIKDFYGTRDVILQANTNQDTTFRFEIENPFSEKHTTSNLKSLAFTSTVKEALSGRNLQVQTQQAFFSKYLNVVPLPPTDTLAFYGQPTERYFLDIYTRFKVMEEVMREYVAGVIVRLRRDGFHFYVMDRPNVIDKPNRTVFVNEPLVLLDGLPVFNINKIMAFDPLKIKRLDVVAKRYFHGALSYDGVVSYSTYNGDLGGFPVDARALYQEYTGLQVPKEFYTPRYDTPAQKQSRLLDLRNLLFWSPVVSTENGTQTLDFYTSDQSGKYQVVVQGLSPAGLPGSTSFTFEVKRPL